MGNPLAIFLVILYNLRRLTELGQTKTENEDNALTYSIFRHEEDWGEGLDGVGRTVLCLLNVSTGQVSLLIDDKKLPDVAPSGPLWCPNQTGIVFLGRPLRAYRLGLKYCTQRPCQLYHLDLGKYIFFRVYLELFPE